MFTNFNTFQHVFKAFLLYLEFCFSLTSMKRDWCKCNMLALYGFLSERGFHLSLKLLFLKLAVATHNKKRIVA